MTRIETILNALEGNVGDFTRCCQVQVCSENLLEHLDRSLAHGRKLSHDIEEIMKHLASLRAKLTP